MITYKILEDKCVEFILPAGSVYLSEHGDKFSIDAKELIEFGKVIQDAKFEFCKKFRCSLDSPECS
jgi:hypothetical protein